MTSGRLGAIAVLVALGLAGCDSEPGGVPDPSGTDEAVAPTFTDHSPVERNDLLDVWWEESGLEGDRPDVTLVREVRTEEWTAMQSTCMTEAGFPPELGSDGSMSWVTPPDQVDSFELSRFTCRAQYPESLTLQQPFDVEQLEAIYEWFEAETVPCYAEYGYPVSGLPSLQAFVDSYGPDRGMWLPRDGVEGGTVPFEVVESCPHLPPREQLYTSTP